jgi:nucleoid-associated protein YgaU
MKNPLVLFVGAAVVAVAALAGATADRWQDWPGPVQPPAASPDVVSGEAAEPAGEPESKLPPPTPETAGPALELRREQPAETAAGPAPHESDEQVAAVGADEIESAEDIERADEIAKAPVEEPERLAAVDAREAQHAAPRAPAEPDPDPEASAQPRFDVVRLEEDGSLIVAGLAAPGAEVTLLLDGEAIASDAANDFGAWLLMPDARLPPGSHQLMVQARDADSGAETSGTIAVAVPERSADRPRVAHSEPAQPPAAEEDVAAAPDPVELGPAESEEPARLKPEEPPSGAAEEEQVALAPVQEPDVEVAAPVVREPEPREIEAGQTEAEPEQHAAVAPEPELELEPAPEPEPERRDIPLALETVDYNDEGEIVFSGRADPGSIVRIHVDNRFVGETTADADGRWVFAGGNQIAAGRHTLRADLTGADGNVVGRIILPFVRADRREVAALVETRRGAVVQREPEVAPKVEAPEPAEAVAEPEAPVVAEEVAPELEPEAPVVAEGVGPEPEPEAPVVADEVAPEPEPEAPVVADEVAPEPEPEIPVVVDEVAPEPEAPVVADHVTPEPEPDVPVVAEEVAPEPEAEAPAVADIAPEPVPEAPVVADDIAPEPETVLTDQAAPEPGAADQMAAAEPETVAPAEGDEAAVGETAAENGEPEVADARPGHVVIQPGNNLWRISRVIYGRGIEYTAIYEANRDKIRDPDLIYPGQIFATPGVVPPKEIDPQWRDPLSPDDLARQDAAQ